MRSNIVEGEPGIFPDPVARLFRAIGRLFDRRRQQPEAQQPSSNPAPEPADAEEPTSPPADQTPKKDELSDDG